MTMNDEFLKDLREEPRPEFARELHARIDAPLPPRRSFALVSNWTGLKWAAGLAAIVLLFSFPSVRAAAQDFLDLFRIKKFVALPIDPERIAALKETGLDLKTLLADDFKVIEDPGKPKLMETLEDAGARAGFVPLRPTAIPLGTTDPEIYLRRAGKVELTANLGKLRTLVDALNLDDVELPAQLDGAVVSIDMPASVVLTYRRGDGEINFVQSHSPAIALPEGVDLAKLGELGLRITGMPADEAASFARNVDWHSTLLVPVPVNAASFREVNVHGNTGLLITTGGTGGSQIRKAGGERQRSMILWAEGDMVYALGGGAHSVDLVAMANSIQ